MEHFLQTSHSKWAALSRNRGGTAPILGDTHPKGWVEASWEVALHREQAGSYLWSFLWPTDHGDSGDGQAGVVIHVFLQYILWPNRGSILTEGAKGGQINPLKNCKLSKNKQKQKQINPTKSPKIPTDAQYATSIPLPKNVLRLDFTL